MNMRGASSKVWELPVRRGLLGVALVILLAETLLLLVQVSIVGDTPGWLVVLGHTATVGVAAVTAFYQLVFEPLRREADAAVRERADTLDSVVRAADAVTFRTDAAGRWTILAPAWEKLTGLPVAEALGRLCLECLPPEDREACRQLFLPFLRRETQHCRHEIRYVTPDGDDRWIQVSAHLILDHRGNVTGASGTLRDVTERREAERTLAGQARLLEAQASELVRARSTAAMLTRVRSDFLSSMSHDLRTPMNGVLGMAGLLLDTGLDDEQREYAAAIQRSADSLLGIVNDILDLTKIEAGNLVIEPVSFDLRVAVEEVADVVALRAHEKGLELIVRTAPEVPRYVVGDPGRIRQILSNLAGNAIKFTTRGRVFLNIELTEPPGPVPLLRFSVEDTGVGIPRDRLAGIFDTAAPGDRDAAPRVGGAGLGLAICRELTGLMGGEIGVDSVEGQGATFWFSLPLPVDASARPLPPPRASLTGVRALIVDADQTNRQVFSEQLDGLGLRPSAVSSGEEALAELANAEWSGDPYGLALLPAGVPDMDGEALGRLIKADARLHAAALLYLTHPGRPGDGRRIYETGFAAYLVKPLRHDDLQDALALSWEMRDVVPRAPLITRHSLAEARAAGRPAPALARRAVPARVLVVEDNAVNQKLAVRLLQKLRCRVDVAGNGREAVDLLVTLPYDLVFMDCQMPELDGFEATRLIRASETAAARVPIVAMTADALRGDREKCLEAGMDDYVSKPIQAGDLAAMVERWGKPPARDGARGFVGEEHSTTAGRLELSPLEQLRAYDQSGGSTLVADLCRLFLTDTPRRIAELRAAVSRRDAKGIHLGAHTLKGTAWIVGARQLGLVAETLEQHARDHVLGRADDQVTRLEREFARIEPFYQEALETATAGRPLSSDVGVPG